ncbi:MAG: MFS transporter [Puniceicoccales bacterium]|jgi:hypothetical protein|nr:MFS transporter [Puniceicoccales bacterium]
MFENFSKTDAAKKTFLFDISRCLCSGIVESAFKTFALVVAIRVFNASKVQKSLLQSAWFFGYFITTMTQSFAAKQKRFRAMDIAKIYLLIVSLLTFVVVFVTSRSAFLTLTIAAMVLFKQPLPLMEDVYGQNYSSRERGSRLSFVLMLLPISAAIFSPIGAKLMDWNLQNYRLVFLMAAIAAIGSGISFSKIPSRVLPEQNERSIFSPFKIIFRDKLFGKMLLWWSFAGIATQMMLPLKAEYLVNSAYGINASNFVESVACVTIPYTFRMLSTLSWGRFFDKSKIITVKLMVNLFVALGFLLFFNFRSTWIIYLSSIFSGIAWGGGEVVWCLWATRVAPKNQFSRYMSVNVTIVGLRGLIGPFLGYWLSHHFTLQLVSLIATTFVLISTVGLLSLRKDPRFIIGNET